MKASGNVFSKIADEAQDCSNCEQLAMVVRYCVVEAGKRRRKNQLFNSRTGKSEMTS